MSRLLRKLGVDRRAQLVALAARVNGRSGPSLIRRASGPSLTGPGKGGRRGLADPGSNGPEKGEATSLSSTHRGRFSSPAGTRHRGAGLGTAARPSRPASAVTRSSWSLAGIWTLLRRLRADAAGGESDQSRCCVAATAGPVTPGALRVDPGTGTGRGFVSLRARPTTPSAATTWSSASRTETATISSTFMSARVTSVN